MRSTSRERSPLRTLYSLRAADGDRTDGTADGNALNAEWERIVNDAVVDCTATWLVVQVHGHRWACVYAHVNTTQGGIWGRSQWGEVRQVVSPTLPFPLSSPSPFPSPLSFQTNQWEGRSDPVKGKFPSFLPTDTALIMCIYYKYVVCSFVVYDHWLCVALTKCTKVMWCLQSVCLTVSLPVCLSACLSVYFPLSLAPCGLQGCKNRPTPFPLPDVVKGD